MPAQQIDALKKGLKECFGNDPMESKDLSRIVNSNHFTRLVRLLDEDEVSNKIVLGGQKDQNKLWVQYFFLMMLLQDSI